jgi:hypothetical protein
MPLSLTLAANDFEHRLTACGTHDLERTTIFVSDKGCLDMFADEVAVPDLHAAKYATTCRLTSMPIPPSG